MSAFCELCSRDPDTDEYFCVRTGHLEDRCPFREDDSTPWDAEKIAPEENTEKGEDNG